jgi:hypothetical protein
MGQGEIGDRRKKLFDSVMNEDSEIYLISSGYFKIDS